MRRDPKYSRHEVALIEMGGRGIVIMLILENV